LKQNPSIKAVTKYFDKYAEPEIQLLNDSPEPWPLTSRFDHVLVIPAYRESILFFDRLANLLMSKHAVLLIVVINQPDTLLTPELQNQTLWDDILKRTLKTWCAENLELRSLKHTSSAVLLVDRFHQSPIPKKQGVGLARKIGADLALSLISHGFVSQRWIYTSDADAHLPSDYFSVLDDVSTAAAVYPTRHICGTDKIGQATQLYEQRLQQYVNGLSDAGSPYAYHTLGSALAINATAYAKVRGFPKRDGGEDFYLLNKAAKTGGVLSLPAPEILIEARLSDRVPFGTGPAINRLLSAEQLDQAEIFYHPDVFKLLQQWLQAMPDTWSHPLDDQDLSPLTRQALKNLGINNAIKAAQRTSGCQTTYVKHMHTWFDGFKTLRFIHLLRDDGLPNIGLKTLTAKFP
jgi:hypothetical protein